MTRCRATTATLSVSVLDAGLRGVNYFRRSATTISAGEGLAKELAGDRSGAR
jgi:hypothetical protein